MEDYKFPDEVADEQPKAKRNYSGFFFKLILVILIIGAGLFWWKFYYTYSDGYRAGILQKLSHKGNLVKTYEGELIMSSVVSNNNVALASEKFYFSVANDSLAQQMMQMEGKYVRLHYEQKKGKLFWRGESTYIVDELRQDAPSQNLPGVQ